MAGTELHAALAGEAPEQAVRMVFTTGAALAPETAASLERAGARWIEKPFTMEELRALIRMLQRPSA